MLGYALVALNLTAGCWGLARKTVPEGESRIDRWFVQVRATAVTTMIATGVAGLFLLADGARPGDPLHTRVYGPFMVVAVLVALGYRAESTPLRFQRVFAVANLVIAALGARALFTA